MAIKDSIERTQKKLEEMMKKYKYKKANDARQAAVEERVDFMTCYGKLNESLTQFNIVIRNQAINIQEGIKHQYDTNLQEDELWDAAIGYMLVKDAQYALKSFSNYDSIKYAYDLLNGATDYMSGGKLKMPLVSGVRRSKERNSAGYLTSNKTIKIKEELLGTFFEELKITGDIEKCLASALNPAEVDGRRRRGTDGGGSGNNSQTYRERLRNVSDGVGENVYAIPDPDSIDINVPTTAVTSSRADQFRSAMDEISDETDSETAVETESSSLEEV